MPYHDTRRRRPSPRSSGTLVTEERRLLSPDPWISSDKTVEPPVLAREGDAVMPPLRDAGAVGTAQRNDSGTGARFRFPLSLVHLGPESSARLGDPALVATSLQPPLESREHVLQAFHVPAYFRAGHSHLDPLIATQPV